MVDLCRMKKYIAEAIGVFLLTLVLVLTAKGTGFGADGPLAMGLLLMGLTYVGRLFSAGHYNPAISIGLTIVGELERREAPYYVLAQLLGALVGSAMSVYMLHAEGAAVAVDMARHDALAAILAELIGTFVVVMVFHRTPMAQAALANGATWTGLSYAFRALSGGVFNPALALAMMVTGMVPGSDWWVYLVGQLLGTAVAASVAQATRETSIFNAS